MSLTSYRAAPPRVIPASSPMSGLASSGVVFDVWIDVRCVGLGVGVAWVTWRRPTFPRLRTQYHGRWGFSRPSSGWDRVQSPRQSHQIVQQTRNLCCVRTFLRDACAGSGVLCMLCVGFACCWRSPVWMTAVQGGTRVLPCGGGVLGNRADRAIRTS